MAVRRLVGGRYEITRLVRADHISRIYQGYALRSRRHVTIEVLREALARDDAAAARFLAAAEATAGLDHPNIPQVDATGKVGDLCFVVSDATEGGSLRDVLSHEGTLGPTQACSIAAQVCDALAHAHEHDVVHGGLTPADILVAPDGGVTVVRFGVAVCAGMLGGPDSRYAAPEQRRPRSRDHRSDLYALGCCLYEMLVGRPPGHDQWHEDELAEQIGFQAPAGLGSILRRLLAGNPADRYPDAATARDDLRHQQLQVVGPPVHDPGAEPASLGAEALPPAAGPFGQPERPVERRRPRATLLAASGGLLVIIAAVGVSQLDLLPDDGGDRQRSATAVDVEAESSTTTPRLEAERATTKWPTPTTTTTTTEPTTTTTTTPPTTTTTTAPPTTTTISGGSPSPPPPSSSTTTTVPAEPVPSVMGLTREQAEAQLARSDLDMSVQWVRVSERWADDRVLYQSPEPEEPRPESGTVTVWVGDYD